MRRCVDGRDYMRDDGVVRCEEGCRVASTDRDGFLARKLALSVGTLGTEGASDEHARGLGRFPSSQGHANAEGGKGEV